MLPLEAARFYSPFISSAQRLPNGDTLITEGSDGRIFEVTPDHETVWEYISPYWGTGGHALNMVYRTYRAPYEWVPQLERPKETAIARLDKTTFRVPGAAPIGRVRSTPVQGVTAAESDASFCVTPTSARST